MLFWHEIAEMIMMMMMMMMMMLTPANGDAGVEQA